MTNEHDHPVGDANPSDHAADADSIPAPHFDGENTNTTDDLINDQPPMSPEEEALMLRAALSEANEEIARQADAVQRGLADLANLRRRHDEERLNIREQSNSRLLVHLLPIVDELDLAVNHLNSAVAENADGGVADSWSEGVRLIQRKLAAFLESEGVTRIESLGELFNPELHEAVGIAQVSAADSGCVVEVLRQGYRLHNRVVQAAQVVVNQ